MDELEPSLCGQAASIGLAKNQPGVRRPALAQFSLEAASRL